MKYFKYQLNGSANVYELQAENTQTALRHIRRIFKLSYYYTRKVDIWETTKEKEAAMLEEKKVFLNDVLKTNPHLCLTDF